jgi:polar amino acid transport system substrate-binding protein
MSINRRTVLHGIAALPACGILSARAQGSGTTWQQIKARKVLRVGAAPGDPWVYKDPLSEKWTGVGVMLGEQMAKDLGISMTLVETTWANAPAAIQANQIDVQFVLDATEARRKAIDFPDQPLFYYAM